MLFMIIITKIKEAKMGKELNESLTVQNAVKIIKDAKYTEIPGSGYAWTKIGKYYVFYNMTVGSFSFEFYEDFDKAWASLNKKISD